MSNEERELWQRFRQQGDLAARARLVERHLGLVHHMARAVEKRTGADRDDLISAGSVGLLQAVERFDPERGHHFSTFALRRIRGAMLDEMRRLAPVSRRALTTRRRMTAARDRLEGRLGRPARAAEVALELGVEKKDYLAWEVDTNRTATALPADMPAPEPIEGETPAWLVEALTRLPPRERKVISLRYGEELNDRAIGEVLGVTESRVSQIRNKALSRLRDVAPARRAS
ncbi:MAG TPA: sigma-70 family RNA polymerase sigma factor [Gemmatimonadales bacterium]|nr:sigma-70 family RNA polymerase sigma factor [Gemmatimonadales bacterium]